jgi:hypothetical protein
LTVRCFYVVQKQKGVAEAMIKAEIIFGLFRIVISASVGADFPMIPCESALFSRGCKLISLRVDMV